jgi:3'-phosphoadenosine 5'-phosphosulfate sulfotransferase (PAPS reductase)/FAD synthetase
MRRSDRPQPVIHRAGSPELIAHLTTLSFNASNPPVRILNCLGLRAEESPARAKKKPFDRDEQSSNGRRNVDAWLPIHSWSTRQVWERIRASGVRHHPAYDLGMPRLSCCFCIFSPRSALLLAGKHNPALLAEYVAVEKKIGHAFRLELPLASIEEALAHGEQPGPIQNGVM